MDIKDFAKFCFNYCGIFLINVGLNTFFVFSYLKIINYRKLSKLELHFFFYFDFFFRNKKRSVDPCFKRIQKNTRIIINERLHIPIANNFTNQKKNVFFLKQKKILY